MDDFQARLIENLKKRHEGQIRKAAERIAEHIGYVLQRLDSGQPMSAEHYARSIEADAHEMRERIRALDAIEETLGVLAEGGES